MVALIHVKKVGDDWFQGVLAEVKSNDALVKPEKIVGASERAGGPSAAILNEDRLLG